MSTIPAPSLVHLALEPLRGTIAHVLGSMKASTIARRVPAGDGAPVLVIPGLATSALSTITLRRFLRHAGYRTYDWSLGRNVGPRGGIDSWLSRLEPRLVAIHRRNGGVPVHVVGWSLGGLYARELAKRRPDLVRQVVTLGSPLSGDPEATNGKLLYRLLAGGSADADDELLRRVRVAPQVRCTSIYSKIDGVVAWQSSKLDEDDGERAVEIRGVSHLGLVSDPRALSVLAHVLAERQPA